MVQRIIQATLAIAIVACSSSHGNDEHGAHDASTSGGSSSGTTTSGEPKAPTLTNIVKMTGALHVNWTVPDGGCDSIVGERKTATSAYAEAFSVPGDVDNKHDATATEATTYTYRLRCKKGTAFSPYSNEMSANPQQ